MQTNQTPEALAEEIKRLAADSITAHRRDGMLRQTKLGPEAVEALQDAINSLRDMAASGAKECAALQRDAERYQAVREFGKSMKLYLHEEEDGWGDWRYNPSPAEVDAAADAAIATTKRGAT